MEEYTNELIRESSPYLLQHAHNRVNWVAWSDGIFEKAKQENKLVLISVGYSSCHWCHVMEHESFEDEEVAAIMNKFFINVKVDREERPDVDQVYMTAVQLMTQRGGWPLNCICLPDGRPVYGGTYFPKEQWIHVLKSIHHAFQNELDKVVEYAEKLHEGIIASELITSPSKESAFIEDKLNELILRWRKQFDLKEGGDSKAPKFPLPNNLSFLLDYGLRKKDEHVLNHVELTLNKMALGGIYDQIGGGFSRYSVDMLWKVPHFEKMLYDNGQLIGLYSIAYKTFKHPLYKRIVYQSINWLEREMSDESGAFYSAIDADSEGIEGKYYTWSKEELHSALDQDFELASEIFDFGQRGYWEEGNYILLRTKDDKELYKKLDLSENQLENVIHKINDKLLSVRKERIAPGLDDKCLTSWNAMILKGLCQSYSVFGDAHFLRLAKKNVHWLLKHQLKEDGSLNRNYKKGESTISGFLDDYAQTIDALIELYRVTFDESWLTYALQLTEISIENFFDKNSGMFFYTSISTKLIARKMELHDNVIPASNSVMAKNLHTLGIYFRKQDFIDKSKQMLSNVLDGMEMYGSGYSNWALLLNRFVYGYFEIIVSGEKSNENANALLKSNTPEYLLAVMDSDSTLPIFNEKQISDEQMIQVCLENSCLLPAKNIEEVIERIT